MSRKIDVDQVQKALNEAAHNARYGPPSIRADRFHNDDALVKAATAERLLDLLRKNGPVRQKARGAHEIWHNIVAKKSLVVPATGVSRRNANALLLQVGLPKAF